jgi:glucan 1,3-beta-glucosidase
MALRGVNLGGWLVLERWITPSLFDGYRAQDEYSLCQELAGSAAAVLASHRDTFITEQDFAWLAAHDIEAVRIPVGYWIFDDQPPFVGGISYLDRAFEWAATHHLKVLLDLHAAPGSQNGWDHSGRSGKMGWHKKRAHITQTLAVLERLAERYGHHPMLYGIEPLNEPHWHIPKRALAAYYESAYHSIRRHTPPAVAVVISDAFRPYEWADVLPKPDYHNVILDHHFYQCFDDADKRLDISGHLAKASIDWQHDIATLQHARPVIVGEWSLGLASTVTESDRAAYAAAQKDTFSKAAAWFFWTYKTETMPDWDLRKCAVLLGLTPRSAAPPLATTDS